MLAAAVATALESGFSGLTYAKVADHLGTSDRMVVYYFPTKTDLISAVVGELAQGLFGVLGSAMGDAPLTGRQAVEVSWPVFARRRNDPVFRLFFELVGLSNARVEPYVELCGSILREWAAWLEPRMAVAASRRRAEALSAMAQVDGLLLLRQTLGARSADEAFEALMRPNPGRS